MATQLFSWDVESGTLADYFPMDQPAANSISTAQAFSGTKSIKFEAGASGVTGLTVDLGSGHNEIYLKWQWYLSSTTSERAGGRHGWRLSQRNGSQWLERQVDTSSHPISGWSFNILDTPGGYDSATTYDDIFVLPLDQWFKWEIYLKLSSPGTSDGIVRAWVNDVLEFEDTTVQFVGSAGWTQFDTFLLNTNWDSGTALWYKDDIEVWDGMPPGGGSPPAATRRRGSMSMR